MKEKKIPEDIKKRMIQLNLQHDFSDKTVEDVQNKMIQLSLHANFSDCESESETDSESDSTNLNKSIANVKDQTYDDINMNNDDEWENINLDEYDISGLCFELLRGEKNDRKTYYPPSRIDNK